MSGFDDSGGINDLPAARLLVGECRELIYRLEFIVEMATRWQFDDGVVPGPPAREVFVPCRRRRLR